MKILITGGAGFIGSNLAISLKKLRHQILVIDNLDSYYQLKLKKYNLEKLKKAGVFFKKIDIRDQKRINLLLKQTRPDIIIHLAAKAGVRNSILFPQEYFDVNVNGTLNILQAAKNNNVKKVLVASSSSVYGNNSKVPFSEKDLVDNQISPYAASKKAMEVLCKMYSQTYKLNILVFRFFTVYGPSGRPDMAPAIFTKLINQNQPIKIFGSVNTQRDYTFIDDIVKGLTNALTIDKEFDIYNLGNNNPVKLKDFILAIETALSKKAILEFLPPQPGDVKKTWADITKAKKAFKFSPQTSINEGIKKFVKWYQLSSDLY